MEKEQRVIMWNRVTKVSPELLKSSGLGLLVDIPFCLLHLSSSLDLSSENKTSGQVKSQVRVILNSRNARSVGAARKLRLETQKQISNRETTKGKQPSSAFLSRPMPPP
jgi:hypothetical protein